MTVTSAPIERSARRFFIRHRSGPTAPARRTLIGELAAYASTRRKRWLLPIIVLLAPLRWLVRGKEEDRRGRLDPIRPPAQEVWLALIVGLIAGLLMGGAIGGSIGAGL